MTPNPKDQLGVSMVVSGGAVSPENRSNEEKVAALARWLDYQFESPSIGNQVRAIGAWLAEVAAERDAALARIAAVEATLAAELARFGAIREIRDCLGAGPMDYELFVDELDDILAGTSPRVAVLAASPTPTGAETETKR